MEVMPVHLFISAFLFMKQIKVGKVIVHTYDLLLKYYYFLN